MRWKARKIDGLDRFGMIGQAGAVSASIAMARHREELATKKGAREHRAPSYTLSETKQDTPLGGLLFVFAKDVRDKQSAACQAAILENAKHSHLLCTFVYSTHQSGNMNGENENQHHQCCELSG